MRHWDYCINDIIDPLAETADAKDYQAILETTVNAHPEERMMSSEEKPDVSQLYRDFWFRPGDPADALKDNAGILMLHNSWTPHEYRAMSADEFLKSDVRLAALLRQLI